MYADKANIRRTCLVKVFAGSKKKSEAGSYAIGNLCTYRFGVPTGFLEALKTTRFIVGFLWEKWETDFKKIT